MTGCQRNVASHLAWAFGISLSLGLVLAPADTTASPTSSTNILLAVLSGLGVGLATGLNSKACKGNTGLQRRRRIAA